MYPLQMGADLTGAERRERLWLILAEVARPICR